MLGVERGSAFLVRARPCGPILKSIHSFIHGTGRPICHHIIIISSSSRLVVLHMHHALGHAFCCMTGYMPVCATLAPCRAATDFYSVSLYVQRLCRKKINCVRLEITLIGLVNGNIKLKRARCEIIPHYIINFIEVDKSLEKWV